MAARRWASTAPLVAFALFPVVLLAAGTETTSLWPWILLNEVHASNLIACEPPFLAVEPGSDTGKSYVAALIP